jgi:hypothetical protein
MKSLIVLAALASTSSFAGVVGHIHFQKASTWVNAFYSKSLCLDGKTYKATIATCLKYENNGDEGRTCVKRGKKNVSQPMVSTRLRCNGYSDDDCVSYERVSYVQSPNITVKFTDRDGDLVRTEEITVPSCK